MFMSTRMTKGAMLTARQAEILLAGVIVARSTSYLFAKVLLGEMELYNLLAVRFLFAFAVLALVFQRRLRVVSRREILYGAILGGVFFLVMAAETAALLYTTTSNVSFLENTAVIWVPLMAAAAHRRRPAVGTLVAALVAMGGVACLTLQEGLDGLSRGHALALLSAGLYAMVILLTARFSRRVDAVTIGILQVGFMGAFSLLAALLFETPHLPATGGAWGCLAVLIFVCTVFGFTLQPLAQSRVSEEKAGLFCALNPAAAAALGAVFLREPVYMGTLLGAVLIVGSLFLPSFFKSYKSCGILRETEVDGEDFNEGTPCTAHHDPNGDEGSGRVRAAARVG